MFYLAHFLFESPAIQDRTFGYFTCLAEAADSDQALEQFEKQILKIAETSDMFDETRVIYLEDIIEFQTFDGSAVLTRFEMFAGERPPSANITLPDQEGAEHFAFYRPVDETEETDEGVMTPFIEFENE